MYRVKTRNWNCKGWVLRLLKASLILGVRSDWGKQGDGDGKFWLETTNPVKAWVVWGYFMLLGRFSGGWTYIVRPNQEMENKISEGYKSIY